MISQANDIAMAQAERWLGWFHSILIVLLGDLGIQLRYLVLVIIIDTIMGAVVAVQEKRFALRLFFKLTSEKLFVYACIIALFNAADIVVNTPEKLRWLAMVALLTRDIFSSLNHADRLGYSNIRTFFFQLAEGKTPLSLFKETDKESENGGEN